MDNSPSNPIFSVDRARSLAPDRAAGADAACRGEFGRSLSVDLADFASWISARSDVGVGVSATPMAESTSEGDFWFSRTGQRAIADLWARSTALRTRGHGKASLASNRGGFSYWAVSDSWLVDEFLTEFLGRISDLYRFDQPLSARLACGSATVGLLAQPWSGCVCGSGADGGVDGGNALASSNSTGERRIGYNPCTCAPTAIAGFPGFPVGDVVEFPFEQASGTAERFRVWCVVGLNGSVRSPSLRLGRLSQHSGGIPLSQRADRSSRRDGPSRSGPMGRFLARGRPRFA